MTSSDEPTLHVEYLDLTDPPPSSPPTDSIKLLLSATTHGAVVVVSGNHRTRTLSTPHTRGTQAHVSESPEQNMNLRHRSFPKTNQTTPQPRPTLELLTPPIFSEESPALPTPSSHPERPCRRSFRQASRSPGYKNDVHNYTAAPSKTIQSPFSKRDLPSQSQQTGTRCADFRLILLQKGKLFAREPGEWDA
jgi:hypothetical protein